MFMGTFVLPANIVISGLGKDVSAGCCRKTHIGVQQNGGIPCGSYFGIGVVDLRICAAADNASITIANESLTPIVSCILLHQHNLDQRAFSRFDGLEEPQGAYV